MAVNPCENEGRFLTGSLAVSLYELSRRIREFRQWEGEALRRFLRRAQGPAPEGLLQRVLTRLARAYRFWRGQ